MSHPHFEGNFCSFPLDSLTLWPIAKISSKYLPNYFRGILKFHGKTNMTNWLLPYFFPIFFLFFFSVFFPFSSVFSYLFSSHFLCYFRLFFSFIVSSCLSSKYSCLFFSISYPVRNRLSTPFNFSYQHNRILCGSLTSYDTFCRFLCSCLCISWNGPCLGMSRTTHMPTTTPMQARPATAAWLWVGTVSQHAERQRRGLQDDVNIAFIEASGEPLGNWSKHIETCSWKYTWVAWRILSTEKTMPNYRPRSSLSLVGSLGIPFGFPRTKDFLLLIFLSHIFCREICNSNMALLLASDAQQIYNLYWLVVWTPLKNISQLGWLFPIHGKIKNVPNHQPV